LFREWDFDPADAERNRSSMRQTRQAAAPRAVCPTVFVS
jgi:hypothetical protein